MIPQIKPRKFLLEHVENQPGVFSLNVDNTSLETTICPRMGQFRMVHGRESASGKGPLLFGQAKHHYLEARLKGASIEDAQQVMINFFLDHPFEDEWRNLDHALEGMRQYEERWVSQPMTPMEHDGVQMVEIPFAIPLVTVQVGDKLNFPAKMIVKGAEGTDAPYIDKIIVNWTGKIDLVWADHPTLGGNWVTDHKTSSIGGATFWGDFKMSQQTVGYTWACRQLFPDVPVQGAIVNAMFGRKPTRTGVANEFERMEFEYPKWQTDEWQANTAGLVRDFVQHLMEGFFPQRTKACFGKYGSCRYHDVCTAEPQARATILYSGLYKDVTWDPTEE